MNTLILLVAYDGTNYHGMQLQHNTPTIQLHLEAALHSLYGQHVRVTAAGRTDSGVHARGMVVHARISETITIPARRLPFAVNAYLPKDIRVRAAIVREGEEFHARFDCNAREYSYSIDSANDPLKRLYAWQNGYVLEEESLLKCAEFFTVKHDFTTFSKQTEDVKSYICDVSVCEWTRTEKSDRFTGRATLKLRIRADRFLYGMVRLLVGAMIDVARGKRSLDEIKNALVARDRSLQSPAAPACGLVFERAYYPEHLQIHFQEDSKDGGN